MTGQVSTLTVYLATAPANGNQTLPASGTMSLYAGGIFAVSAGQAAGNYAGSFTVTISYTETRCPIARSATMSPSMC